jgi:hypothetical protein
VETGCQGGQGSLRAVAPSEVVSHEFGKFPQMANECGISKGRSWSVKKHLSGKFEESMGIEESRLLGCDAVWLL